MQQENPANIYKNSLIFGVLGVIFYVSGGFVFAYILWLIAYATFPIIKKADDKKNTNVDKKTTNAALVITNVAMSLFIFHAISNFISKNYVAGGFALVVLLILYGYFLAIRNKAKNANNNKIDNQITQQKYRTKAEKPETIETPKVFTDTKQKNIFYNLPKENEPSITTVEIPSSISLDVNTNIAEVSKLPEKVEIIEDEYMPAQYLEQLHNTIKNLNTQPFVKAELNSVIRDLERLKSNASFGVKPIHFVIYGNNEKGKVLMSQIIADLFRLNDITKVIQPEHISLTKLPHNDNEQNLSVQNFLNTHRQKVVVIDDIDLKNNDTEQTLRVLINNLNETNNTTLLLNIRENDITAIDTIVRQNRNVQFRKLNIAT